MIDLNKKKYKDLGREIIRKHLVRSEDEGGFITISCDTDIVMAEFKDRLRSKK